MCRVTRELPAPIHIAQPPLLQSAPVLAPSTSQGVFVKTAENRIETKQALVSRSSNVYEMGPVLHEGKFGSICVASVLQSRVTEGEEGQHFERASEKPVALKIYSMEKMKNLRGNANTAENPWFEIELQQMIGNSKHPNLVGVIETSIIENSLFIVLPFFRGGDLLDLLENHFMGPLPAFQVKRMFAHVLKGLQFLHDNGIVHRDISLENILYDDETDTFALCDFGMALRVPRDSQTGSFLPLACPQICGKEGYIAPELWSGDSSVDAFACDIWSCGIVLFMALTGSAPMQRAVEGDPYYQLIKERQLLPMLASSMSLDEETYRGLELAQAILDPSPSNRPSANTLLLHSWLA